MVLTPAETLAVMPMRPDISDVVIEDDEPVDSLYSEKLQRLLTSALYASFQPGMPFLATANVGLFYTLKAPPLVPDVMVSLEVSSPENFERKEDRTYFVWEMGKPPDVVIEIVSNRKGRELGRKLRDYAHAGVSYYIVYDPLHQLTELQGLSLAIFERVGTELRPYEATWMPKVGLGLTLWNGAYEGVTVEWLRWCDEAGNLLLTGEEQAEQERQRTETERQRTETERQRAETERQRAETERQRADHYLHLLQEHGINLPES